MASVEGTTESARLEGMQHHFDDRPEGPISAAILAGGVGALVLGLLTTLAEANETIKGWLELTANVGPLGGKTIFAVAAWLVAWVILHVALKRTEFETRRAFTISMILLAIGIVGTFPTFFRAFAPG